MTVTRCTLKVADLAVASPATVSRCGMVYLEPGILGLAPFVTCWLRNLPELVQPYHEVLQARFDRYLQPCVDFVRRNTREIVPSVDGNLTFSLFNLMDCYFAPFGGEEMVSFEIGLV